MTEEESSYVAIGEAIEGGIKSQMFGKPCFKLPNKKAFISFFQNEMVFKLTGTAHQKALSLDGAHLFDPSGKGRPMKEWVQVPVDYKEHWTEFAEEAAEYVGGQ